MAIQGFFTGDVKIRDLNGVLKAVDGIVEVATDAGTVTSVGLTVGSTGTDVNVANSPITSSGNITLNLPTASATNRGLLSSADWSTFNSKQNALGYTPANAATTLTINGTTYDLSANRSWSVGTVTSVGLSAPTGFSVSGSPVTSSGTLALAFASGYSLPTTAKQTTWDTAYDRSLTAASVSGTTTKTLTLTKQDGSTLTASWTDDNTDAVTSVFGRTGAVVATSGDYTTAQVTESGNLYFTNARAIASTLTGYTSGAGTITSSDSILSAIQKLNGNIGALTTGVSSVNGLTGAVTLTTSNIAEGTNLYYTEARVSANTDVAANTAARHNAVTIGTANGLSLSTQVLSLGLASTSTTGALSSTDWNTFNSKQAALTFSAPLINTSGTISIPVATSSVNGYLSSADWDTFNNKQAALSGTGFVKISGTTISYDNSTYYLASNPSSFITLTALSATAPLSYSNTTGVFSISQATTSTDGYLSSTDWNTFNNKQAAGNYITALTGEATASGPGSASVTLSTSAVTGKLLTGLNLTGGGTIADTDSILQAFGKVQNQISGLAGGVTYQGTWNASTNTPTLTSSVGTKGYYYIVSVAGSTNLNGITDWKIGDWAIFNGTTWDKVDNTDAVSSVNGFTGAVSLTTSNISEGTNLYYLDSRARLALSFTAGSGAYDNTTGVITIPTNTSQLTNGANFITLSSLSASSPLAYDSGTGAFSIQVATGSQNGYLSSTDWTTFDSKQPSGNYVTTDTTQTITALKTFTAKVVINTGGTDDQLQLVGTAPSIRLNNAATGATINGFIAMSGGDNNYIQGSVSGDMTIGNQNNGKILFGFGSGTATRKMSLDSSGNAVLSGGLTLGSTLSNGTYTYTLPSATGTLALTSDIPSLTGYVPYTGASANVDLGTFDLTADVITGATGSFASSGGSDTFAINHSSGSGIALNITKGGNNEGLYINKTSGSGNAATIIGTLNATTLVKSGGTSAQFLKADGSVDSTAYGTGSVTSVGLSSATSGVTIGSTPITTSGTITLAIATASGSQQGLLSSTDWTTFNNKQSALTNPVTGTGTNNYIPKFTTTGSTIGDSLLQETGTNITLENNQNGSTWFIVKNTSSGSGAASGLLMTNNGGDLGAISLLSSANTPANALFIRTLSTNPLVFGTGNTEQMRLDASGNLGLGVTPSAGLATANYRLFEIGLDGGGSLYSGSNQTLYGTNISWVGGTPNYVRTGSSPTLYNQSNGEHSWSTAPTGTAGNAISFTQAMTLDASGRLGIGTTSPGYKLSVNGVGSFVGSGTVTGTVFIQAGHQWSLNADQSGGGSPAFAGSGFYIKNENTSTIALGFNTGGAATFSSSVTATSFSVSNGSISNSGFWGMQNTAGAGSFADWALLNSATTRIMHNPTGTTNMIFNGNVGIGTTSPSTLLTLQGNGVSPVVFAVYSANPNSDILLQSSVSSNAVRLRNGADDFQIHTNASERMRITSGGNVGIGSTNPSIYKLQVNGTAGIVSTANAAIEFGIRTPNATFNDSYLIFGTDVHNRASIHVSAAAANSGNMIFTTYDSGNGAERMSITSGGNVEINTGSIKTGEPDTGYGRAAFKIGSRQTGEAFDSGGYIPISIDGTVYFINLYTSTP
jgi:hypothetical protein